MFLKLCVFGALLAIALCQYPMMRSFGSYPRTSGVMQRRANASRMRERLMTARSRAPGRRSALSPRMSDLSSQGNFESRSSRRFDSSTDMGRMDPPRFIDSPRAAPDFFDPPRRTDFAERGSSRFDRRMDSPRDSGRRDSPRSLDRLSPAGSDRGFAEPPRRSEGRSLERLSPAGSDRGFAEPPRRSEGRSLERLSPAGSDRGFAEQPRRSEARGPRMMSDLERRDLSIGNSRSAAAGKMEPSTLIKASKPTSKVIPPASGPRTSLPASGTAGDVLPLSSGGRSSLDQYMRFDALDLPTEALLFADPSNPASLEQYLRAERRADMLGDAAGLLLAGAGGSSGSNSQLDRMLRADAYGLADIPDYAYLGALTGAGAGSSPSNPGRNDQVPRSREFGTSGSAGSNSQLEQMLRADAAGLDIPDHAFLRSLTG